MADEKPLSQISHRLFTTSCSEMRIDMAIEYLGLSEINGPLVAVEGIRGAFYDEIVELVVEEKQKKLGRIVEINNDYAVVQVFESTEEMSLLNTHARLTAVSYTHLTLPTIA